MGACLLVHKRSRPIMFARLLANKSSRSIVSSGTVMHATQGNFAHRKGKAECELNGQLTLFHYYWQILYVWHSNFSLSTSTQFCTFVAQFFVA